MEQATGGADYVRAILPVADHRPWLASYGKGLLRATKPLRLQERELVRNATPVVAAVAAFPTPARAPDLQELNGLLQEIAAVTSATLTNGGVVALGDDWRTQGQWLGRYGRFWAVLCANWSPNDDVWGAGWGVQYDAQIGGNHAPGDSLRYWVHWLATKDNRCLEMTPTYLHSRVLERTTTWDVDRRESEWDDHGEEYPMTKDGPHLYCSLNIPAGLFYLSLYEVNPNGQEGGMRFRDYQISIRPHPGRASLDEQQPGKTVIRSFYDIAEFDQKPELAHARASDFWNGVYKRFLVRGPTKLTIQVNRNNSYNTILPAVMLDLVDELPPPYHQTRQEWEDQQTPTITAAPSVFYAATTEAAATRRLQAELGKMPAWNAVWWAENQRRFHLPLLRWHVQAAEKNASASGGDLATCYYRLGHFMEWEKKLKGQNVVPARDIEKALRWDGVTYSCAGKGNEIVAEYLRTHPARLNATMPGKPD